MAKVKLVLKVEKLIRGKKFPEGTIVAVGETTKAFEGADLDKAIQLGQVACLCENEKPEKDEKK